MESLMCYEWPGNMRELENVVERALIQHKQGRLYFDVCVKTQEPERNVVRAIHETAPFHPLDHVTAGPSERHWSDPTGK